ncbi:hypothetical protein [Brevundimonas sp.]|uniref:hypothetical protein n=1 Tax=Brevundimonas sp. TaxID=1871086 RepID=UPI002737CE13|nr:hypothetical protein [Brevundimonas sp.]MDP3801081.1 hypothetical protein [Brevundimonas sp.]
MIAALASVFLTAATPAPPPCRFAGEPRAWTSEALASWDRLDRERLRIAEPVTPVITLFDEACAWTLTPDDRGDFRVGARRYRTAGAAHSGQVSLPDGGAVPARKLAFASPMSDGRMFFIMALPSVWRADPSEPRDWSRLSMVVFMHEFAHTQQAASLGVRIDGLLARGLPEDSDDDVIQNRFGERPDYPAAYEIERNLFYQAAAVPDAQAARAGLASAARAMEIRRGRWFREADALYAEADDVFLTLEGTGNWAAWMWLTDARGGRLDPSDATAFVRGGGHHWSQDEGLGIMLAIDRLTPDWPALAFAPRGATADRLIERALRSR